MGLTRPHTVDFNQAVRFRAVWREDVDPTVSTERVRFHDCVVSGFCKDHTWTVRLRTGKNSGLWGGVIVKRQKVLDDNQQTKYVWQDVRVGQVLEIFGREYKILDCDERTRNYYSEQLDVEQPHALPFPTLTDGRASTQKLLSTTMTSEMAEALKQRKRNEYRTRFLNFDRQVLRFFCAWDDRQRQFGDKRYFTLHFYLADMTIEIKENVGKNSGRVASGVFLSRSRLPKKHRVRELAEDSGFDDSEDFVMDHNLRIGKTVDVFGKQFLIYDCDDFTQTYYHEVYGLDDFTPIDVGEPRKEKAVLPTPRHNGFGAELDSYQNTKRLQPKKASKNSSTWQKYDGKTVRCLVKWVDAREAFDRARNFNLTLYLGDGTIAVFEQHEKGVALSSKFLQRGMLRKHDPQDNSSFPKFYGAEDIYVGARLVVYGRTFQVTEIDATSQRLVDSIARSSRAGSRAASRQSRRGATPVKQEQAQVDHLILGSRPPSQN